MSSSIRQKHDGHATDVKKGPWTAEEDSVLVHHVSVHGEGRWNSVARSIGLKRTGKSCRLRWLNYLRPDVRRGNISLQEQLTILELHCRWGNRWSRIAQHLPGRTDNEIKNYWRTRVQKQAKHLNWDVNSQQFRDTLRYVWMPRLAERIRASSGPGQPTATTNSPVPQSDSSNSLGTELQDGSGWCSEKVDWWGAEKSLMDLEMAETSVWNWSGDENISFLRQELFDESSFGDVQTSLT